MQGKHGPRSRNGGVDPLWSKAPFVMFRYPGLFASLAVGALLLALAAAAYPLFISASASELLAAKIDDPAYTRWAAGLMFRNGVLALGNGKQPSERTEQSEEEFTRLAATSPYLAPPLRTAITAPVSVADAEDPTDRREGRLFTGEGVESQLEIVEGAIGDGAVVPDHVADALDLSVGDTLVMFSDRNGSATVPVDGIYRRIYHGNLSGYFRPWRDELIQRCFDCPPPPQPVLMSESTFLGSSADLRLDHVGFAWQAPLERDRLTLDEADEADRRAKAITQTMSDRRLFTQCSFRFFCSTRTRPGFGSSTTRAGGSARSRARRTSCGWPACSLRSSWSPAPARSRWPRDGWSRRCCSPGAPARGPSGRARPWRRSCRAPSAPPPGSASRSCSSARRDPTEPSRAAPRRSRRARPASPSRPR